MINNEEEKKIKIVNISQLKKNKSSTSLFIFKSKKRNSCYYEVKSLEKEINKNENEQKYENIQKDLLKKKNKRYNTIKQIIINESTRINKVNDEESLFLLLKTQEENSYSIKKIFGDINVLNIIKIIIQKEDRDDKDTYILVNFLKSLSHVMDNISLTKYPSDSIISLLINISINLKYKELEENVFLFHIDDIGKEFYIILSGEVNVLLPKYFEVQMSEFEYINHLMFLLKYNEKHLFNNTFKKNNKIFPMSEIYIKDKLKKYMDIPNSKIPLDIYLSYLNGEKNMIFNEKSKINKYNKKDITICGYYKITQLKEGNCFGEVAFKKENSLRTASIFTNTVCSFAYLDVENYNSTLKTIQQKTKMENIIFLLNIGIFDGMNIDYFEKKYWELFCSRVINKGEIFFSNGENFMDEIIFIKNGEISLESKLNVDKFNSIINYLNLKKSKYKKENLNDIFSIESNNRENNINLKNEKEDNINKIENEKNNNNNRFDIINESMVKDKKIDINIGFLSKGEVLGLDNMIYDGAYFCTAKCVSEKCEFFSLQKKYFDKIIFKYPFLKINMHKYILLKKEYMYKTFLKVKNQIIKNVKLNLNNLYKISEKPKKKISNNLKLLTNTSFNFFQTNITNKNLINNKIKLYKQISSINKGSNKSLNKNFLSLENQKSKLNDFFFNDNSINPSEKKGVINHTHSSSLIYFDEKKIFENKKKKIHFSHKEVTNYPKINLNKNYYNNVVFGYKNMNIILNKKKLKKLKLKNYLSILPNTPNKSINDHNLIKQDSNRNHFKSFINKYDCLIYDNIYNDEEIKNNNNYKNEKSPLKGLYKYNKKMKNYKSQSIINSDNENYIKKTSFMYLLKPNYKLTKKIYL